MLVTILGMALLSTGEVRTWGKNNNGQLGNNDTNFGSSESVVQVKDQSDTNISNVIDISALGRSGVALTSSNTVYTWGDGASGQIGDGGNDSTQEYAGTTQSVIGLHQLGKGGDSHVLALSYRKDHYESFVTFDMELDFNDKNFLDNGEYQFHGQHFGSPTYYLDNNYTNNISTSLSR